MNQKKIKILKKENLELNNIIDICVATDIAILSLAYPILIDKISNIGERYSSEYLEMLFNMEFPQSKVLKGKKITYFQANLYITVSLFVFQIFRFEPWKCLPDWWIINNSADLLILLFSSLLIVLFFILANKVVLFSGKSTILLSYLIKAFKKIEEPNLSDNKKTTILKTINEITFYSIEKSDKHLEEDLMDFYFEVFNDYKNEKNEYPDELYYFIFYLNKKLNKLSTTDLEGIENHVVTGKWLLQSSYNPNIISQKTYNWLWKNFVLISDNDKYLKSYWRHIFNYYKNRFQYSDKFKEKLDEERFEMDKREFVEFHLASLGILFQKRTYEVLKYYFEYSNSNMNSIGLIPNNCTDIYKWFVYFNNPYLTLDRKYPFPEFDNLGISWRVDLNIKKALVVAFLRIMNFNSEKVNAPHELDEKEKWFRSIEYFKFLVIECYSDDEIKKHIEFPSNKEEVFSKVENFSHQLKNQIEYDKINAELSKSKLSKFINSTNKILSEAFQEYFIKPSNNEINSEKAFKLYINGESVLFPKSTFIETANVHDENFDTFYADSLVKDKILSAFADVLNIGRTQGILLNNENFILGIKKLISNKKDIILFATNLDSEIKIRLKNGNISFEEVNSNLANTFFILNKNDLPKITLLDNLKEDIEKLKLEPLNKELKVDYSVLDINKPEHQSLKKEISRNISETELNVLVSVSFTVEFALNKKRKIIQLAIRDEYLEQGSETEISEIEPL